MIKRVLCCLLLFSALTAYSQDKKASIHCDPISDWERAKIFTKNYLEAMPAEFYDFRPTPEIGSFAEEYLHLACVNVRYASMIEGTSDPCPYPGEKEYKARPDLQSKEAVIEEVMQSYDTMIRVITEWDDAETITDWYGWYCSNECVARKGFEHQTHHRGKTAIYLRLKGITPPLEMLIADFNLPKDITDRDD